MLLINLCGFWRELLLNGESGKFLKPFFVILISKGDILKDACAPTQTREVESERS